MMSYQFQPPSIYFSTWFVFFLFSIQNDSTNWKMFPFTKKKKPWPKFIFMFSFFSGTFQYKSPPKYIIGLLYKYTLVSVCLKERHVIIIVIKNKMKRNLWKRNLFRLVYEYTLRKIVFFFLLWIEFTEKRHTHINTIQKICVKNSCWKYNETIPFNWIVKKEYIGFFTDRWFSISYEYMYVLFVNSMKSIQLRLHEYYGLEFI